MLAGVPHKIDNGGEVGGEALSAAHGHREVVRFPMEGVAVSTLPKGGGGEGVPDPRILHYEVGETVAVEALDVVILS